MIKRKIIGFLIVFALVLGGLIGIINMINNNVKAQTWTIEIVDSNTVNGGYTSIALDSDGNPHISYYDRANKDLLYAEWTGSNWSIQTVDFTGEVGLDSDIALDINDNPHISYFDNSNLILKYAKWTGSSWDIQIVDSEWAVGQYTSIALDSIGYPHISYFDFNHNNLKYARWSGSSWDIQTVDGDGDVGWESSITLDSKDHPHISYFDKTDKDLKYAKWIGSSWDIQIVDSEGNVGMDNSMALDTNDYAHISYSDVTNYDLKYTKWSGTVWDIQTVDSKGVVGYNPSIALDTSGNAYVSYLGRITGSLNLTLKFARWTGLSWNIEVVDSAGEIEWKTSLAIDVEGYAHISYCEESNDILKYARIVPPSIPSTTQNLQANAGDGQITLSWTAPISDGGSSINNYKIYRGTVSGGETYLGTVGDVLTYTDTRLTNGQIYYYKVSAINDAGEGPMSNEAQAMPTSILKELWLWIIILIIIVVSILTFVFLKRKRGVTSKEPTQKSP